MFYGILAYKLYEYASIVGTALNACKFVGKGVVSVYSWSMKPKLIEDKRLETLEWILVK